MTNLPTPARCALLIALILLPAALLRAQSVQDTLRAASRAVDEPSVRSEHPLGLSFDFRTGIAVEYIIARMVAVEVATLFDYHSVRARVYLMHANAAPFVSIGYGYATETFALSDSVAGNWIDARAGIEYARDHGFARVVVHATVSQDDGLNWPRFIPSFAFGFRF